ncbi:MAG: hypothetical protein AABY18_09025 [Candidatus Thermoplasmatota archaeon]
MAVRPIVVLSLLTFALVAGCSDGPAKGDLVAIPGALTVEGTAQNDYVAAVYPNGNNPVTEDPLCADVDGLRCTDPSSNYTFHFMSLEEPSGDGYAVFQVGGAIGERSLVNIVRNTATGMWEGAIGKENVDESTMFESFELRMGDFTLAKASAAAGSQAFVPEPILSGVTVTGSYKGRNLDIDVQGLPADAKPDAFVGRFYTKGISGNLTLAESFPLVPGAQTLVTEQADVGDYVQFHIHVGSSKIYVYQATIE